MKRMLMALAVLAGPAVAAEPPRPIDMTVVLRDTAGQTIPDATLATKDDPACAKCAALTLGAAAAHALFASYPDERELSYEMKWARGALAARIELDKAAVLTAPELALVERLIGKLYTPLVVTAVMPLLDPAAKPAEIR